MNPAMPDAVPLTPHFLASLSQFLEQQHGGPGQGDISENVKVAIAQQTHQKTQTGPDMTEQGEDLSMSQPMPSQPMSPQPTENIKSTEKANSKTALN